MGTKGRLEIDLNYLYRVPLWKTEWRYSPEWPKATRVKILDIHEIAAGKLNALLEREVSRDLFDSHQLLTQWPLDHEKLRLAFTVYAAMRKHPWEQILIENVKFSIKDIRDKLIPVLKNSKAPGTLSSAIKKWGEKLMEECKASLSIVLPFKENETEFLVRLQKFGEIRPDLINEDKEFCEAVKKHPLLLWRAQQVI